ncbi:MAG: hypothetical protein ACD_2C00263G0001 [uncultured bacterium (gcode 4)]|uniref:Uncharacterized protein n=1 Tax=uncultured bacterium (gcode 4) TaxID=1234023 RepID=K2GZI7_9BACT|nr:MAG: hypothetical protein ACD_2C00263G0001 [uncultured bacterium (gcode 4)]
MRTILDEMGRVTDMEVTREMALIEKPYREKKRLIKLFRWRASVILEWEKLSEAYLSEIIERMRIEDEEMKEAERLKDLAEEERLRESARIKMIEELSAPSDLVGEEFWEFDKRYRERNQIFYEQLSAIYEKSWIRWIQEYFGQKTYNECMDAEEVIRRLFKYNRHETFSPLIKKIAKTYLTASSYDDHSLCHLFENYGRRGGAQSSLAWFPGLYGISADLMENSIRKNGNCLTRVLSPLPIMAMEDVISWKLDEFTFRPDCLDIEWLQRQFENEYHMKLILLMHSKSPREYAIKMVGYALENHGKDADRFIEYTFLDNQLDGFLGAIAGIVWEDKALAFKSRIEKVESALSESRQQSKRETEDCLDITCVDVDDTLIKDWKINKEVLSRISESVYDWGKVVIFSSWDISIQTSRLRDLWVAEIFLPVLSKEDFKWVRVAQIIDDTKPQDQGLSCKWHIDPKRM